MPFVVCVCVFVVLSQLVISMQCSSRARCCKNSGVAAPINQDAPTDGEPEPCGQSLEATTQELLAEGQPIDVGHSEPVGVSQEAAGQVDAPTAEPTTQGPDRGTNKRGKKKRTFKQFDDGTQPPYTGDEDVSDGLACFLCDAGSFKFADWCKLSRHLKDKHGMRNRHLAGTYLDEARRAQRATGPRTV